MESKIEEIKTAPGPNKTLLLSQSSEAIFNDLLVNPREKREISVHQPALCAEEHCDQKGCIKWCSGCRAAAYCSAKCQEAHWETHKQQCIPYTIVHCVAREDMVGCGLLFKAAQKEVDEFIDTLMAKISEDGHLPEEMFKAFEHVPEYLNELKRLCAIVAINKRKLTRDDIAALHAVHMRDSSPVYDEIPLDEEKKKQRPIMHYVLATGNKQLLKLFTDSGADLHAKDSDGYTGLQVLKSHEATRQLNALTLDQL